MLDENWLISLFKNEYFLIKEREELSSEDKKYLYCFEEVLFGKRKFRSPWKNLNEFYKVLGFSTVERYKFRESFGYIKGAKAKKLEAALSAFTKKYENSNKGLFFSYQVVSFNIGLEKDFSFYDGGELINIDEISKHRHIL